jgi:gluconolactonase
MSARRSAPRHAASVMATAGLFLAAAAPAVAVPDCNQMPRQRVLVPGPPGSPRLESITPDYRGRLLYTDISNDKLMRLDGPGQQPKTIATGMARPGGLVFDRDGSLVAGFNGGALSGVPANGMAGLFRMDAESGRKAVFAKGMDQANGVVEARDGSFYASNDIGGGIARVRPDGTVEEGWAESQSPNGLVIDSGGRYLFANQTFTPAQITRFELANPRNQTVFYGASSDDTTAGLDGLTRDGADRLYGAANGAGQVWKVDRDGKTACALARGLTLPSAVAFGAPGSGFDAHNLYVVSFGGAVVELFDVTDAPPPPPPGPPVISPGSTKRALRLRVRVSPRRVRAGRRTRFAIVVKREATGGGLPAAGARVAFGGRRYRTRRNGRVRVRRRFRRAGFVRVRASLVPYAAASTRIRVLRRRRAGVSGGVGLWGLAG